MALNVLVTRNGQKSTPDRFVLVRRGIVEVVSGADPTDAEEWGRQKVVGGGAQ